MYILYVYSIVVSNQHSIIQISRNVYNITMDTYFIQYKKSTSNAHTSYYRKTGKINHGYNYIKTAFYSNMQLFIRESRISLRNATAVATAVAIYV